MDDHTIRRGQRDDDPEATGAMWPLPDGRPVTPTPTHASAASRDRAPDEQSTSLFSVGAAPRGPNPRGSPPTAAATGPTRSCREPGARADSCRAPAPAPRRTCLAPIIGLPHRPARRGPAVVNADGARRPDPRLTEDRRHASHDHVLRLAYDEEVHPPPPRPQGRHHVDDRRQVQHLAQHALWRSTRGPVRLPW